MNKLAIETELLCRRFGALEAVRGVNLRVQAGQFYGFLGPNGAGKSTTIKMLTGLLEPSAGRIRILGLDLTRDPLEVKRQIGVVPKGMTLFEVREVATAQLVASSRAFRDASTPTDQGEA